MPVWLFIHLALSSSLDAAADTDLKAGETAVYNELRAAIPKGKIKTADDLYAKWQEIQNGKSKAVIIDIRTEAEFDAGHILNSNNVDSGHAYGLYKKIKDSNTEIWVTCRTKHRASYFVGMLYKYGYTNVYLAEGGNQDLGGKRVPLGQQISGNYQGDGIPKKA
ncbi:Rhodanese domain-containing protein [Candidatus Electrothrix aarhusensis]